MIRVAPRWLLACCVLVQGPALANSADTDWLLEEIRSQLETLVTKTALDDCLHEAQCSSLVAKFDGRSLLVAPPPARFARQYPTQERPWFIDLARNGSTRSGPSQWSDYSYRRTSLMQTVKSLERVSLATFWERDGIDFFPRRPEFAVLPRATEPLLDEQKGRRR